MRGSSVKLRSSDIRLIFGLQCGKSCIDLLPGQRPVSDFIQCRCRDTSRITSKLVKTLFLELKGWILLALSIFKEVIGSDVDEGHVQIPAGSNVVIDAYVELSRTEQLKMYGGYVHDIEDGTWKHFNPIRQRSERINVHYIEALVLNVSNFIKQLLPMFGLNEQSIEANFSHPLESAISCPQQKADTLDCGIIVYAIMPQYMHHYNMEWSLQGTNCSVLCVNMVKFPINSSLRGLKD
ncbi:hypothetical protein LOK49_LG15G02248 [Camellia lanceoleosa]|uniref:Uncharacterized protein n=1 Tax=Camellia lanceoleosa TaxID=1840588 RepID=A0ACC0F264_9ERIC|nr:hypothetical protein LOK49_LG15G02248 [Camellia lanceoleosa]